MGDQLYDAHNKDLSDAECGVAKNEVDHSSLPPTVAENTDH